VIRQAGLAREIASEIARYLAGQQAGRPIDGAALAAYALRIEEKADRIAIEARNEIVRLEAGPAIEQLVDRVEEAIDELEQAAFIASIMPAGVRAEVLKPLADLCSAAVSAAEAAGSGVDAAPEVPEGKRVDAEDALAAVSRLHEMVVQEGVRSARDLDCEALERLATDYRGLLRNDGPPDEPMVQLTSAARAVYRSWMSERAQTYRRLQHLEHLQGTAVTVQAMVFGNCGDSSAAGVAFSRDPSTGAAQPVIEVLFEAQGEDVVAGRHTPDTEEALARTLPTIATQLRDVLAQLEREFGDVQDVEFTIEDGRLYVLQTRAAKRTPRAALRIAIDLVHEGLITPAQALRRLDGIELEALTHHRLLETHDPIARGVGASSGVASGRVAFDSAGAKRLSDSGDSVILVRPDTNTADVAGFAVSAGIVTVVGGSTAHAALVARQMGKPCVVGCDRTTVDVAGRRAQFATAAVVEGEWISIDGDSGQVYLGRCKVVAERPEDELAEVERWRQSATPDTRCIRLDEAARLPLP
jgi:pyruvate, orthophosphate dikinase